MSFLFEKLTETIRESWTVLGQMAPYLLFGFVVAGLISMFLSADFVKKHLGGSGIVPVIKAAILGVPLPLCSCSVIPVSTALRKQGASRGATLAFLLSTPQTGVDSIAVTWGMMGPVVAIFRAVAALVTGLLGGAIQVLIRNSADNDQKPEENQAQEESDCHCYSKNDTKEEVSHCQATAQPGRLRRGLIHGFITLPREIGPALLLGISLAGILAAVMPAGQLSAYLGGGISSILILMMLGVPVYVCATASVPIAIGFMHAGASPGAALAFLISGPATNMATIATVWKILGRRATVVYILTVAASAVGFALLLDSELFIGAVGTLSETAANHQHPGPLMHISAVLMLGLLLASRISWGKRE
jgi:uncharacterized protein